MSLKVFKVLLHHIIFVKVFHMAIHLIMEDQLQGTTLHFGYTLKSTYKNIFFMVILSAFYHLHQKIFTSYYLQFD